VISREGKPPEVVCGDHRPYGKSKTSLEEVKRIRRAGGWVSTRLMLDSFPASSCTFLADIRERSDQCKGTFLHLQINNGRVCGILSVSRAFGDMQLKTRRLE
jgi:protein phosphatase 1A